VRSPFPEIDSPLGLTFLRWIIGAVLVFGLIGCVVKGADNPDDPYLSPPTAGPGSRTPVGDFGEARVAVQTADKLLTWCLLLAANDQQRARGLMEITDPTLGGHDGMLFRYDRDVGESFWMRNTPMPLSIAYITSDGQIRATFDMEPCSDSPDCRDYPPGGPYRFTIEVPQGRLPALGIVEGATVVDENAPCST
jgi:uncharacterized membrane protein (UPF0127 family)